MAKNINEIYSDELQRFLTSYPKMSIKPKTDDFIIIEGIFDFSAKYKEGKTITDSYELQISVPKYFPRSIPTVYEIGNRIPRIGEFHVNQDGSLCLGSRLRILWELSQMPTLIGFAEQCIIPYLFAISCKMQDGGEFPFGELAHGIQGEIDDYKELFGLKSDAQVVMVIKYLGIKKRHANKLSCPCGCGLRLGKCNFNHRLNQFRQIADRSWFRSLLK